MPEKRYGWCKIWEKQTTVNAIFKKTFVVLNIVINYFKVSPTEGAIISPTRSGPVKFNEYNQQKFFDLASN